MALTPAADLLLPRIVARRAKSHPALASNCLMLAVYVAKTAVVTAAGCQLTAARLNPSHALCHAPSLAAEPR
jgi:hypothetical protein